MEKLNAGRFFAKVGARKERYPLNGQIELTYCCNLDCVHCYCKGSENRKEELNTSQWKKILDEIKEAGCLFLNFSGGEPLIRKDFLELYAYAREKGFIVTIFTNGLGFNRKIIRYFSRKSAPLAIEITLNGITQKTYEAITQTKDSFSKVIANIKALAKEKLKVILKANCLKQNKDEIVKIKQWTEGLLGRPSPKGFRFKYSTMVFPRLNGERTPLEYRISLSELIDLKEQDADMWKEYQRELRADFPDLSRKRNFLYHCNSWFECFFINPYGRLKFCEFSEKFSIDLKTTPFVKGFYEEFPKLLAEEFKTNSLCQSCKLRSVCFYCPARAYLETGNEEGPVPDYCQMAEATAQVKELTKAKKSPA